MRTRFLGSQSSQPSHPISAFTVSSAHSILVPFAMRQNLALWSVGSQNVSRCKASEAVGRARSLPIRLGGARRSLGTVRTPGKFDEMSLGPCAHPVHTQSPYAVPRSIRSFLESARRARTLGGHPTRPGVRDGANRLAAEAAPQQAVLVELLEPLGILHIGFAARDVLDVARIHEQDLEAASF